MKIDGHGQIQYFRLRFTVVATQGHGKCKTHLTLGTTRYHMVTGNWEQFLCDITQ